MKALSFDIGINNLAFCEIDTDNQGSISITKWEVIDLKEHGATKDFMTTAKVLVDVLHDYFYDSDYDMVLIENQPVQKNPAMKSIQMMVFSFFCIKRYHTKPDMQIRFVSACNKLKVLHQPLDIVSGIMSGTSSKYAKNKKASVAIAKHYLQEVLHDDNMLAFFTKHKKKDDLADSMLQCIYILENN